MIQHIQALCKTICACYKIRFVKAQILSCKTNPHGCYFDGSFLLGCDILPFPSDSWPHFCTMFPLVYSQYQPYLPCITEHFLQHSWLTYPEHGGFRFMKCWYLSTEQNGVTPHKMVLMLLEILQKDDYYLDIAAADCTEATACEGK